MQTDSFDTDQQHSAPRQASQTPTRSGSFSPRRRRDLPVSAILIAVAVLLFILGAIFIFARGRSDSPDALGQEPTPVIFEEAPSPTPAPEVDREEVAISVLNGTGIAGEASFLQAELEDAGFATIEIGNADEDTHDDTSVRFADSVPDALRDEILSLLEDLYTTVDESSRSPSGDIDVEIVTGLRPGVDRPTPEPTEEPSEEDEDPTPTPENSPTPSDTPTPTP